MATSKKKTAAKPHAPKVTADAPAGTVRVYPTHRRGAGPLTVALPGVDGAESGELVIDDDGADIDQALADQLIAFREVTTDAPDKE